MQNYKELQNEIAAKGFAVIPGILTDDEVNVLIGIIGRAVDTASGTFRKTNDLFAIRRFLHELPETSAVIFNDRLKEAIAVLFGDTYFAVKSIYFDKPPASNWFVAWHQDLTISVNKKIQLEGYGPWTVKPNQYAVQPPVTTLEDNFTIRIHLDETNENNGALKVIPGSHLQGVYPAADVNNEEMETCAVERGGIMIMKPLLMHSSGRTVNNERRRVIHIEFSRIDLPEAIQWSEYLQVF